MEGDSRKVRVGWLCEAHVGQWHYTEYGIDCDECQTEFETVADEEDWKEGICEATCPRCKTELTQRDDSCEIVK